MSFIIPYILSLFFFVTYTVDFYVYKRTPSLLNVALHLSFQLSCKTRAMDVVPMVQDIIQQILQQ